MPAFEFLKLLISSFSNPSCNFCGLLLFLHFCDAFYIVSLYSVCEILESDIQRFNNNRVCYCFY